METGLTYLAIAYGGFFVLLAAYLHRIVRRDQQLRAEVDALGQQTSTGGLQGR